jgi:hypothetical protein
VPKVLSQFLSSMTLIEETGLSPQHFLREDRKGDKNNFAFNSLYYKNVAKYDKRMTIDMTRKRDKTYGQFPSNCHLFVLKTVFVYSDSGQKSKKKRYFSHENHVFVSKNTENLIDLSKPEVRPMIDSIDFIAIHSNRLFSQLTIDSNTYSANPLGVYDQKTALWSEGKDSIDDIPVPKTTIQFHSMKDQNTNETIGPNRAPTREQHIFDKTQEFNAYLRDNERDVKKWLKFIEFQDKCVEPTDPTKDKIDGKTIESVIWEKKLSICQKGLSFNSKSIELLLCRLEIVSNVWEFEKMMKEWKQLAFLYPNSMEMWRKYIEFSHKNITHFQSSKTLKFYEKCVNILSKMLEKTLKSDSPPENLEQELVSILSS